MKFFTLYLCLFASLISCGARCEILAEILLAADGSPAMKVGSDTPQLQQAGWRSYQLLVRNPSQLAGELQISSPNAAPLFHKSRGEMRALPELEISAQQLATSTIALLPEPGLALSRRLTGQVEELRTIMLYTRRVGRLDIELQASFTRGAGDEPDERHAAIVLPFDIAAATMVNLEIRDERDQAAFAAITITDGVNRLVEDFIDNPLPQEYRHRYAMRRPWERIWIDGAYQTRASPEPHLTGIYPFPARRLPQLDPFPDLYFQAQIYRGDGEHIYLPPGRYRIDYNGGPETIGRSREVVVADRPLQVLRLELDRWVNMRSRGWYSADLHVHATGCKHIESPTQGIDPLLLLRQARGEGLNVVSVLNWLPGWGEHKQYFGQTLQGGNSLLHGDVEISNFPSNELGHLGLWNLKTADYPGVTQVADWPSWNNPILRWARTQLATTGYLHAGWGLQPMEPDQGLPNYALAPMTGIGANEYVVAITEQLVDLLGVGDTPPVQELNLWYHALNSGYRTRIMGESDFPCIYHEKIGVARSYAKLEQELDFEAYLEALRAGRSYVSDGRSHLIDITVNGLELGTGERGNESELQLSAGELLSVTATVAAWMPEAPTAIESFIAGSDEQRQPAWDIARARIPGTRDVAVELVVNGLAVASKPITANGDWTTLKFEVPIERSSWLAIRIFPSSHSNPLFVRVDGKPIRASAASSNWLARAVEYLWHSKSDQIRPGERSSAEAAYTRAAEQHRLRAGQAKHDD